MNPSRGGLKVFHRQPGLGRERGVAVVPIGTPVGDLRRLVHVFTVGYCSFHKEAH